MGMCVRTLIRRSEDTFVASGLFCFTGALRLNSGAQTCTGVLPAQPSHHPKCSHSRSLGGGGGPSCQDGCPCCKRGHEKEYSEILRERPASRDDS